MRHTSFVRLVTVVSVFFAAAQPLLALAPIASSVSQPASGARARGTFAYEAYQTDLFTGAATLSLPIEVPPGRRGIQPTIAAGYASGSGNDWLGVGWNLSLGFIQRDTTRGIPAYTSSDTFVFSFNGTNDQLVAIGSGEYRAEVEGSFLRFQFDGIYWRITDKSGTRYRFGFNTDARQTIPGKGVFRWAMDRVEDLHGNYLTIAYTANQNQLYPSQIQYTGNSVTGDLPHMTVDFILEDRLDPIVSYRTGGLVETRKRLHQIDTKVDGALAKRYLLTYTDSPDTFRSLLTSFAIIGSDGVTSLPPLRFSYYQNPGAWGRDDTWNIPDGEFITGGFDQGRRLVDVNGDGLTDLLVAKNSGASWYLAAYKNTGSGWIKDTGWNLSDGNFIYADRDDGRWFAELNGDGFIDIAIANSWSGGSYKSAMVNKGSGWARDDHRWDIPDGFFILSGADNGRRLTDLNGDGLSDVIYAKDGQRSCYINTGAGWRTDASWSSPIDFVSGSTDTGARFVDLNGDGLTDLITAKDGVKATYLNTGSGWAQDARWNLPDGDLTASNQDQGRRFADVNGDGLIDLLIAKDGYHATYINTGSGWKPIAKWTVPSGDFVAGGVDQGRWLADLNGDGLSDIAIAKDGAKATYLNLFPPSDLLLQFDNGVGGTTAITYTASTRYYNSGPAGVPNLPFPMMTVSSVTRDDGLGHRYTTRHDYADGLYDWPTREFRGFNRARVIDADGNYTDTWFKQDNILKGKPYLIDVRDAAGKLYTQTFNTWQSTQPYPGVSFAFLSSTDQYTMDGDGTFRLTQTDMKYDQYGNVIETMFWGEVDPLNRNTLSGDERRVQTEYTVNASAWIMDRPSHVITYDGNWTKLAEAWFYYDTHPNITDSPTKGLLTKTANWLSGSATNPYALSTYDTYGNLITSTDTLNRTVTTSYDAIYHQFPITITNPLNQTIQTTYEPKTGQILTQTDPNSQTARNNYDPLGRLLSVIGPNDTAALPTISYAYDLSTVPIRTTTQARVQSGQAATLTSYTFTDGLGRAVQTRSPAENPTQQVVNGAIEYDARGLAVKQWPPYLSAISTAYVAPSAEPSFASLPFTTNMYDPVGRVLKTTEPNNAITQASYNDWVITTIDANNHTIRKSYDAYGRLSKVEEFDGAAIYTTNYTYDGLGNLIQVADTAGNLTKMTYDTLSRKTSMDDPDMGRWTYQYSLVGNLTQQTDARGATISFTYDALNRLTQKSYAAPPASNIQLPASVSYTYDNPVKAFSKGKLTEISDGSGSSSFEYDNVGRLVKESKTIDGTAYAIQRQYDLLGRLTSITYPDTEVVSYTYNPQGGIEAVTGVKGGVTTAYVTGVDYTATGQISRMAYGNGTASTYSYDPKTFRLSQLVTAGPAGSLQDFRYTFDPIGNVSAIQDAIHTGTQSFQYDALNRLTQATGAYGNVSYAYDPIGNMTQKESAAMSYGLTDPVSGKRIKPHAVTAVSSLQPPASDLQIAYDANGNMVSKTERSTGTVLSQLSYDVENRLIEATSNSSSVQSKTINLLPGWNYFTVPVVPTNLSIATIFGAQLSSITQISRLNPATGTWEHFVNNVASSQFDTLEVGRGYALYATAPVTLTVQGSAPTGSTTLGAGKHLLGNASGQSLTLAQLLNNLVPGVDVTAAWRYNGGIFTVLSQSDIVADGEAIVVQLPAPKVWTFSASGSVATTTRFTYDGDGGRVKVWTNALGSFGTTIFVGSSYEIAPDGTATKYIFAGSQRIAAKVSSGALRYYHGDHLGSSNVITDAAGALLELAEYTPYGSLSRREGSVNVAQKFTGKRLDPTGLYFYEARYYDPQLGRFITPDPTIQSPYDPQSLNRYSYTRNNPVRYTDPTGLSWKSFWRKISGFIGAAVGTLVGIVSGNPLLGISAYSAIAASGQRGGFGRNFAMNFASGAVGWGVGAGIGAVWQDGFWSGLVTSSLGGAAAGAVSSAIGGGDVGRGALAGLAGGAIGYAGGFVWPLGAEVLAGGIAAEIMGGNFGQGALQGGLSSLGETTGGILAPMPSLGSQEPQGGDTAYFKPDSVGGWAISLLEGGVFSHTGTMISNTQMVHATFGRPVEAVNINTEQWRNRSAYISHRFRGNEGVINAARALAAQQISYGFLPGQKVCSTCNAAAFNQAGYGGWHGIGPNSQAQYREFSITRTYGK